MRFSRTATAAAVLVLWVAAPEAARADDTGVGTVVAYGLAGIAAGVFDIAFTVHDVAHLVSGERSSRIVGVVELLGAAPQIGVATYVFLKPPPADGVRPLTLIWAAWAAALAANGIWTIAYPAERQTTARAFNPYDSSTEPIDPSVSFIGTRLDGPVWRVGLRF